VDIPPPSCYNSDGAARRMALAALLDLPDRVDWKNCTIGDRGEAEEATAFKRAFKEFDPCM